MIGPLRTTLGGMLCFFIAVASIAAHENPTTTRASDAPVKPVLPAGQATDDGLARLFDSVCGLQVISGNASRTVAALLAFVPQAELELRRAIYAERQVGRPREIHPGLIAVDVSIPTDRLDTVFRTTLAATGFDASDVRLHPSAGPAIFTTGYALIDGQPRDARPGWRHCTHHDISLSHKAAQHSLRQRVLAALHRMRLSNGQTVGQFSRRHPRISTLLRRQLENRIGGEPALESNGICRLTCTLSPSQMTSMISRAIQDAALESNEELKPELPTESLALEAWAVTPPRDPSQAAPMPYSPRPDWATGAISKTVAAAGPADEPDTVFRDQLAVTAARAEAQRQLWMELEQLPMPDGRCVGEAIAARQDRLNVVRMLHGAVFVMSTPSIDERGVATMTLGIQREAVWQIVGR